MGNWRSLPTDGDSEDVWWTHNRNFAGESSDDRHTVNEKFIRASDAEENETRQLSEEHQQKLNEFKLEFARKHEKRREILDAKRKQMEDLRAEVERLKKENEELKNSSSTAKQDETGDSCFVIERLRKEKEELKCILDEKSKLLDTSEVIINKNRELRINISEMQKELQRLNAAVLDFEQERKDYKAHVVALKDVIAVSKHMLQIRETQLKEVKEKVDSIEQQLAEREMDILSHNLRSEYERQLENIKNLRSLYEERQRAEKREKQELASKLDDANRELQAEQNKVRELQERIELLETDNSGKYDEIKTLESNLGLSKAESRQYQAELAVINQLFSEILLGFNSTQDIDLDKLQRHLEDHHDLLQNIVSSEISSEVSYALPKVLLDLLNQVDAKDQKTDESADSGRLETIKEESESQTSTIHQMNSVEEILENLPKVWRVLIELLSHQKAPVNNLTDEEDDANPCYKTVETPKGPSLVLSVSQTFIRLKDLILEKKSLEKETNHLKQLNGHLENRLQDQEKRLELVHSELSKTWHVVGKMQKQHQLLHTQEKILRYELAQKRKLLTELKEELEYSREKWAQAREKNSNTEEQWKQLRTEFASRRITVNDDLNNSVESGYSDDRESSDDEPGYETDVSECAQKHPDCDDVETLEEVKENVVPTQSAGELAEGIINPNLEPVKTDLAQSDREQENVGKNIEGSLGSCGPLPDTEADVICQDGQGSSNTDVNLRIDPANSEKASTSTEILEEILEQNDGYTDRVSTQDGVDKLEQSTSLNEPLQKEVNDKTSSDGPSCSTEASTSTNEKPTRSLEEILAQRDERLKRMEGQAELLVTKVKGTTYKSMEISSRLDSLHETYSQSTDVPGGEEEISGEADDGNEVPSTDCDVGSNLSNEDNQE
ncbi:hypothetical protein NQ317_011300 [Molorchus minor]|uniref:Uncharacterized protein n=1 Tax=Molorchus minor TaxID=1323400 RepID=A0ABQ9JW48_9CUCU|nr:hypothetical protein NQ317_011300 [Molorchus minor]